MQVDWKLCSFLQGLYQLCRRIWSQQSCHVLDTQGISAHVLNPLGNILPVVQGVGIAQGVAQCNLRMSFFPVGGLYSCLQVADIIQTVKDTDNINTVGNGLLYKVLHNIVCIMVISQDVLSAEQHLQLGVLKSVSQFPQSLPGIFLQETEAGIKGSAAPALNRMVAYLVHLINNGQHLLSGHSGRKQRLVGVTKDGFHNLHWPLFYLCHSYNPPCYEHLAPSLRRLCDTCRPRPAGAFTGRAKLLSLSIYYAIIPQILP